MISVVFRPLSRQISRNLSWTSSNFKAKLCNYPTMSFVTGMKKNTDVERPVDHLLDRFSHWLAPPKGVTVDKDTIAECGTLTEEKPEDLDAIQIGSEAEFPLPSPKPIIADYTDYKIEDKYTTQQQMKKLISRFFEKLDVLVKYPNFTLIAAVSGGPDSLTLALLLDQYCRKVGAKLLCVTVDHGLRKEASNEARYVHKWLTSRGLLHVIRKISWDNSKPVSSVQCKARDARYEELLKVAAEVKDLDLQHVYICTAHTLDDNVETFLMRIGRSTSSRALAGIPETRAIKPKVWLLRPLLGFQKLELIGYLINQRQTWIEDPSNYDPTYKRTQIRQILIETRKDSSYQFSIPKESEQSISVVPTDLQHISTLISSFSTARTWLDAKIVKFIEKHSVVDSASGIIIVSKSALRKVDEITASHALETCCLFIAPSQGEPQLAAFQKIQAKLRQMFDVVETVHDCIIRSFANSDNILIARQSRRSPLKLDQPPKHPLRPFGVLPLGGSITYLGIWNFTYNPSMIPDAAFPQNLYIRQLSLDDIPLVGTRIKHPGKIINILLSLPIIVDANNKIVHFPYNGTYFVPYPHPYDELNQESPSLAPLPLRMSLYQTNAIHARFDSPYLLTAYNTYIDYFTEFGDPKVSKEPDGKL